MGDNFNIDKNRLPLILGALAVVVIGGIAVIIGIDHISGKNSPPPAALTLPTPKPTPTPLSTQAVDCKAASFGSPLSPVSVPSNLHVYSAAPATPINNQHLYMATVTTDKSKITLCLDPKLAPNTVKNFVDLARNHFFDGLTWHRVVANFVIQGGDPKGDGTGGPGYQFNDEPVKGNYQVGSLAMANSGPNTNGSQFFICIGDGSQCASLPHQYNLFGQVISGQDIANKIAQGDKIESITVVEQQ